MEQETIEIGFELNFHLSSNRELRMQEHRKEVCNGKFFFVAMIFYIFHPQGSSPAKPAAN